MTPKPRLIVVGGGVLGTMHAFEGVQRGFEVIHLERDRTPTGASVRNFGLIWISGRAYGAELALATDARQRWEAIAAAVPGTGFRPIGSLTVARSDEEAAALKGSLTDLGTEDRASEWLEPGEVRQKNSAIQGEISGGLFCARDAAVEPRLVLSALRAHLLASEAYEFLTGVEVREIQAHAVLDQHGRRFEGDLVVCCVGATRRGPFGEIFDNAPLRRVRLQMLETEPFVDEIPTAVADGDSMRYYPAFTGVRHMLSPQADVAARWRAQLLLVRRLSGHLTIGDTHEYDEPFSFDISDEPTHHFMNVASELFGRALPPVERRWAGIYCETTQAGSLYYRKEIEMGVMFVNGPGGRGMTMSPAIAAETFK